MNRPAGFTLIEILVATAISMLVLAGGFAAYRQYEETQLVSQSVQTIVSALNNAQSKAKAGEKPVQCLGETLQHWEAKTLTGENGVVIVAHCTSEGEIVASRQAYTLPSDITLDSFSVSFAPITGRPAIRSIFEVGYQDQSKYQIEITVTGLIEATKL